MPEPVRGGADGARSIDRSVVVPSPRPRLAAPNDTDQRAQHPAALCSSTAPSARDPSEKETERMSLAPERIGIGITRHFTTAGVHPYDEVVWERRDARITNWKDGAVAFEQLDVEFPVSWSLNATNIVAQKYFRGTLGTPERERSLRQVIDRVADTITRWGVADGYFVDDQEGAAFRNELKYVLLHQRAAFNSPVWFNI